MEDENKTAEELAAEQAAKEAEEAAKAAAEAEAEEQRKKSEENEEEEEDEGEDPYEAELNRLENERKKAEDIARQKAGALKEAREREKALESRIKKLEEKGTTPVDAQTLKEELKAELRQDQEIERLTNNPKEQELIRYYIKNNGLNIHDAWVLANKSALIKARERESSLDEEEVVLARLSGASIGSENETKNPIFNLAAQGLSEKERKHLKL